MKILFVSAEVAPYSKAGGLADVAGSLPQALESYVDSVLVLTPLYGQIDISRYNIKPGSIRGSVELGNQTIPYAIHYAMDLKGSTQIGFIECAKYFQRDGIYTESNGEGFADNNERYFYFQLVVADLLEKEILQADILHCNDHHTGLLPVLIKATDLKIKTVFTIHNFLYHGHFSKTDLALLPKQIAKSLTKTQWKNYSALLEGVDHCDILTTVSPGYARELLEGMDIDNHSYARIKAAAGKFSGIVNGIDTNYWSPEKDTMIPHHFSIRDLQGKLENKRELLKQTGLKTDMDAPLFGSISRLVENKGFPLINQLLDHFVDLGAMFVFLGSGSPEIAGQLRAASKKHPGKIAFDDGFNEPLAHLIEAGSDLFLMPSRFEPCGLNQLYSLRYGTIPVVNKTGGLADTVEDWTGSTGTGFVFEPYDLLKLKDAMERALKVFHSKSDWEALILGAMSKDFSWDQSAKQYYKLYKG